MPEIQPGFTYSLCGLFTENKERIKNYTEIGDSYSFFDIKTSGSDIKNENISSK